MRKILSALLISSMLFVTISVGVLADHVYDRPDHFNHQNFESQWLNNERAWGPEFAPAKNVTSEFYQEAPGGSRAVQYFDKARMENNSYRASDIWRVTNGLLVAEMVTGAMQMGDGSFNGCESSDVHVAGDPGQANPVTYGDFKGEFQNGAYSWDPVFLPYASTTEQIHQVGLASTRARWVEAPVNGIVVPILVQLGERQSFTYTPSNAPEHQVQLGNVGQHYYMWRYEGGCNPPSVDRPSEPTTDATAYSIEGCSPFVMVGGHEVCFAPLGGEVDVNGNTVTFTQSGLAGEVSLAMIVRTRAAGVDTVQLDMNRQAQVLFYENEGPRVYCQEFSDCLTDKQGHLSLSIPSNGTFAVYLGTTGNSYDQFTLTFGGPASGPVLSAAPYVWQD